MYEDLLPHTLPTEAKRLDRMGHAHDPDTFAAIERLDLRADARCLDIGVGRESVAIWLAETLPDAKVIASDQDVTSAKKSALSNLSLREDLGVGLYDLVHCRAVLCFLPIRAEVLSGILKSLKPGGAFVVTEMDFRRIASGPSHFWATLWNAYLEFTASQGWGLEFGALVPSILAKTEFTEIDARHIQPIFESLRKYRRSR